MQKRILDEFFGVPIALDCRSLRNLAIVILPWLMLTGCEAPLNLEGVAEEKEKSILRSDSFQSAAYRGGRLVVVSSIGAAVVTDDEGTTWYRHNLPERPALIDVTSCANGNFYALDSGRMLWTLPAGSLEWTSQRINTPESTLSISCASNDTLWVSASFSTLLSSRDGGATWNEFTMDEDLQLTAVDFVDEEFGFAVGEFGTVISSADAGATWQRAGDIPNEFYPMAADFKDRSHGWVGGLDGVVWATSDGGQSWTKHSTLTPSPIYSIQSNGDRVYAAGGSGKLIELVDGKWVPLEGAPKVLTYVRALELLPSKHLVVAGGAGTMSVISLNK